MRTDSEIKLLIRRRNWRCDIYQGYVSAGPYRRRRSPPCWGDQRRAAASSRLLRKLAGCLLS